MGFLGGGVMATAMIEGLLTGDDRPIITVIDPDDAVRNRLAARGVRTGTTSDLLTDGQVVVLAVKPQSLKEVIPVLASLGSDQLIVSILAGVTTARIEAALPAGRRIVRAMPNLPLAVSRGVVALAAGRHATAADLDLAETLFASRAPVLLRMAEDQLDAVTAVSGSGPAYIFYLVEALQAAAMDLGFDAATATRLVVGTLDGATACLLAPPGVSAADLRRRVTSPGGTTAAAVAVLDEAGVTATFRRALAAARDRARELARA